MGKVKIDTSQIPESVRMCMLDIIYPAVVAFFKQPGVEEDYQRWLKECAEKSGKEEVIT